MQIEVSQYHRFQDEWIDTVCRIPASVGQDENVNVDTIFALKFDVKTPYKLLILLEFFIDS